jgi:hypothetical protein
MTQDRRRYPRGKARLQAVQHLGNRRVTRTVTSPSAGGLFIEGEGVATRPGQLVVLEIEVPGEETRLKVTAEVVHVEADGAGVRVTRADWQLLASLVR